MSGFAKRDHLGRTSDFELGIWRESTSDELPFALYCAALDCSVAKICLHKVFSRKQPKTFTSGENRNIPHTVVLRMTNDIIASMVDSAQHTVSFTAFYLM